MRNVKIQKRDVRKAGAAAVGVAMKARDAAVEAMKAAFDAAYITGVSRGVKMLPKRVTGLTLAGDPRQRCEYTKLTSTFRCDLRTTMEQLAEGKGITLRRVVERVREATGQSRPAAWNMMSSGNPTFGLLMVLADALPVPVEVLAEKLGGTVLSTPRRSVGGAE